MSDRDPYAEASKLWPHDDAAALESAAFGATWRWREKIKPFQRVDFNHMSFYAERLGRVLTRHVDAAEHERRAERDRIRRAGKPTLEDIIARMERDAEEHRKRARFDKDATPDDLASGW